jgi:hypothetical protein
MNLGPTIEQRILATKGGKQLSYIQIDRHTQMDGQTVGQMDKQADGW